MNLKTIIGGLVGLAVLAIGGFSLWYFVLRDDAPAKVSTDAALDALASRTPATNDGTPAPTASSGQSPASGDTGIEGDWTVDASLGSFVGYRVQEELAGIGGTTAVGRTTGVTGTVAIAEGKASAATITADMTKLKSQESLRDGQLRNQGIEYSKFPTSTFALSTTEIPSDLVDGKTASLTLKGSLTLHGVTKDIEMPVEVTLKDGVLVVVGETDIQFEDYSIKKPTAAKVVGMEDHGVMEVQLFFTKA
ncbi:MAG: YceI family protein [Dehalococcoidia bacterium]